MLATSFDISVISCKVPQRSTLLSLNLLNRYRLSLTSRRKVLLSLALAEEALQYLCTLRAILPLHRAGRTFVLICIANDDVVCCCHGFSLCAALFPASCLSIAELRCTCIESVWLAPAQISKQMFMQALCRCSVERISETQGYQRAACRQEEGQGHCHRKQASSSERIR